MANILKEVENGTGVIVSKFGGEGTGFKSMKDVMWKNNEVVTLIVKGKFGGEARFFLMGKEYVERASEFQATK